MPATPGQPISRPNPPARTAAPATSPASGAATATAKKAGGTLDQRRAAFAWGCALEAQGDYANLAKAAPALIMTNGLMATLAYYNSKGLKQILNDICGWLSVELGWPKEFQSVMTQLHDATPREFRRATEEALGVLRWIRQFADAVAKSKRGEDK